ncbi:MAG TPA: MFS transporter [Ktedonobacteraceae bacterium]|jgi:MFS family permease
MPAAVPRGEGFFTLLRKKHFLLLWLAQLLSMMVLNASNYALIILITQVTGSTTLIGLAIILFSLPAVLFGAPAGVFVDRRNKRRVLLYSNCLRAVALFGFVVSLLIDHTRLVPAYLLTFLVSGIGQFFAPAEGASIPLLVSNEELMPALSLFQVTFMLSNALGFLLFAPLVLSFIPTFVIAGVSVIPIASLYCMMAIIYLICAGLVALIPARTFIEPQRPAKVAPGQLGFGWLHMVRTIWHEMLQAWTFIQRRPQLFEAVIQLSFAGILLLVIGELATPLVTRLLHLPAASMAFVFAPAGLGLVLSSLVMPRITRALGKSRTIGAGALALAMLLVLLPLSTLLMQDLERQGMQVYTLHIVLVAAMMFLAGCAINWINIPANTAMQELTPEWIKGRVLALQLAIYNASSIPVVLLIGGISDRFQLPTVLYVLAGSILAFAGWGLYYERRPHYRALVARQEQGEQVEKAEERPEEVIGSL